MEESELLAAYVCIGVGGFLLIIIIVMISALFITGKCNFCRLRKDDEEELAEKNSGKQKISRTNLRSKRTGSLRYVGGGKFVSSDKKYHSTSLPASVKNGTVPSLAGSVISGSSSRLKQKNTGKVERRPRKMQHRASVTQDDFRSSGSSQLSDYKLRPSSAQPAYTLYVTRANPTSDNTSQYAYIDRTNDRYRIVDNTTGAPDTLDAGQTNPGFIQDAPPAPGPDMLGSGSLYASLPPAENVYATHPCGGSIYASLPPSGASSLQHYNVRSTDSEATGSTWRSITPNWTVKQIDIGDATQPPAPPLLPNGGLKTIEINLVANPVTNVPGDTAEPSFDDIPSVSRTNTPIMSAKPIDSTESMVVPPPPAYATIKSVAQQATPTATTTPLDTSEVMQEVPQPVANAGMIESIVNTTSVLDSVVNTALVTESIVKPAPVIDSVIKPTPVIDSIVNTSPVIDSVVNTAPIYTIPAPGPQPPAPVPPTPIVSEPRSITPIIDAKNAEESKAVARGGAPQDGPIILRWSPSMRRGRKPDYMGGAPTRGGATARGGATTLPQRSSGPVYASGGYNVYARRPSKISQMMTKGNWWL